MSSAATAVNQVRTSALTADEILEFHQTGFYSPGRLLTDQQVDRLRKALELARERDTEYDLLNPDLWPEDDKPPMEPGKSVGFLFNLWLWNDDFREVAFSPVLARWASQLIGARQVRILEDNALYKEPGTGGSLKWHQDYPYWPLSEPSQVTAWIALDDVTAENGAMQMAVGSRHLGEYLPAVFGTGTSYYEDRRADTIGPIPDPEEKGLEIRTIEVGVGEVSFHHPLTWHASGPNISDRPRRAHVIRYCADGAIWLGSRRYEYNYSDDEVGIEIGDPLGGRYFPIVPH